MADDIKVDTRVSAGLHPDNVKHIEGYSDETAAVCAWATDALDAAYRGIGAVFDSREAASQDPTLNEAARAIATQGVADRVFARVAPLFDKAHAELTRNIATYENELSRPIEAQASHQISQEIRQHVSKLSLGERSQFVMRAISSGDHKSATAVLGAPSYLSGLTDEMQTALSLAYHQKHNRAVSVRLTACRAALELIKKRGGLLHSELEKAVGMPSTKVKELRDRKANADRVLRSA